MTGQAFLIAPFIALVPLLIYVAISDIKSRTIPNWLNGAIALLGISTWLLSGKALWPDMAIQLGLALVVFGLFSILFAFNAMGGGDVKLLGALALWFPLKVLLGLLLMMSILGGALTLFMILRHKIGKFTTKIEVPYGVAIAAAGLWTLYERNLNHFG